MPLVTVQRIFGQPGAVSELVLKVDAIDRAHKAFVGEEVRLQVTYGQQRSGVVRHTCNLLYIP
jgi:hypothetical protein